jgi:tetratricopeptide (TPR) repeat protein
MAISELRTYHRMTGRQTHLAVLADCERALGRPERAVDIYRSADRAALAPAAAIELLIVAAGARRDLGQAEAAVAMLQVRELTMDAPWSARLRYAYADGLLAVDRRDEAREWFARALEADDDGSTDAAERLLELDGVTMDNDDELVFDEDAGDEDARDAAAGDEQVDGEKSEEDLLDEDDAEESEEEDLDEDDGDLDEDDVDEDEDIDAEELDEDEDEDGDGAAGDGPDGEELDEDEVDVDEADEDEDAEYIDGEEDDGGEGSVDGEGSADEVGVEGGGDIDRETGSAGAR